jgi:hypothetical protein
MSPALSHAMAFMIAIPELLQVCEAEMEAGIFRKEAMELA